MDEKTYNRQAHAVFDLRYHLVLSTRYRRKILPGGIGKYLYIVTRAINRRHPEIVIHEINGESDHVHLLISIAPKMAISEAVRIIKSNTARSMRKKFNFMTKTYWSKHERGIWSIGYFVSSVGVNEATIKKYIEQQGREDSGQAQLVLS